MKYLVTGGAGFIGSNFIRYVLQAHPEASVVNLDKLTYAGNLMNLEGLDPVRHRFVKGDIADEGLVGGLVRDCDLVVHFAAESHVDRSIADPTVFVRTNVLGTQVLLDAALRYGRRFHHVSTDEVFGSLPLNSLERFRETTPYDPSSPYSASKAASDHLVRAYHRTFGLPVTITNCSNNYGPCQFPEKLIPVLIMNAQAGRPLPIYGDGLNVRDWIYVEDHCRGIDLIVEKGRIGETYLLGGNAERSNLEVARAVLKIMGKPNDLIEFIKDRPGHDRRYAIDSGKIERELGFKREHDFTQGLEKTVEWYLDNHGWLDAIKTKEYLRFYEKQKSNN